jgi:hypothetical protein
MMWDPTLIMYNSTGKLAMAPTGAANPHIALDPQQVLATDDSGKPTIAPVSTPGVLEGPKLHASSPVNTPTNQRDAMATCLWRTVGAVVDSLRVCVVEGSEIGIFVHASVQRTIGHHLDLHVPHLTLHGLSLPVRAWLVCAL